MENILIFSNCAASNSESNGRIHMTHFQGLEAKLNLHNFYLRGNPDLDYVNYINFSNKEALKSMLSFGFYKPKISHINERIQVNNLKNSNKSKKPFFHFVRNVVFGNNRAILKLLKKYVVDNNIQFIVLWGSNVPFLYKYAYKLSTIYSIPLITITCEDYPLKKYNYISKHLSFIFKIFQKSLKKWCFFAYKNSTYNVYTNDELRKYYEKEINVFNSETIYFGSNFVPKLNEEHNKFKTILYGGNLYNDRILSILKIAEYLKENKNVIIKLYGNISANGTELITGYSNINYCGLVPYNELVDEMNNADILLHIEGFSDEYIFDCKYAFSTKISDYIMSEKPLIIYGPKDIAGIKFCYENLNNLTITCDDELSKIDTILNLHQNCCDIKKEFLITNVTGKIYSLFKN